MTEWDGRTERRRINFMMEERLQKLEDSFIVLDKELALLNAELPHLRTSLDNAVTKISQHEENAIERAEKYVKCRDERIRLSEGAKWLWLVMTVLVIANTGILLNMLLKK